MTTFSIYVITYWGDDLQAQITDMIDNNVIKKGMRVILAFASFNFISSQYIPGFGSVTMDEVRAVVQLVHSMNAYISLSIGGATYSLYNSDLYADPDTLAENISGLLANVGFDGVDFNIEDSYTDVPTNFATTAATLINMTRKLNPSMYITLTTPAQAWGAEMYQKTLLNFTISALSAWQPMEYDLWINQSFDYPTQIQADIDYYITEWSIPVDKIIVCLMCGSDYENHVLTLNDALTMTTYAQTKYLKGVMMWDAMIDGDGCIGNAPYAYSLGIQAEL